MIIIMVLTALIAGMGLAVQGPVNMALGIRTSRLQAAMLSFLGGMLVLAVIIVPVFGHGDLTQVIHAAPWQLLGGVYGAFNVFTSIACMPTLGVALTLVLLMFGQLLMGSIIDGFGLLGTTAIQISLLRMLGIAVTALGILLIYFGNRKNETARERTESIQTQELKLQRKNARNRILIMGWAFFSGLMVSLQAPTNASLAGMIGSCESALISFTTGFFCLAVLLLLTTRGKIRPMRNVGIRPWMLTGGLYGTFSVFTNIFTVVALGAALQSACMMAGQLGGGILIDSMGLLQAKKMKINPLRVIGVLAIAAGALLVTLGKMVI